MLEVDALEVSYGAIQALHGVTVKVAPGEIVALVGANGAGKSTLLKAISGFVRPSAGRVVVDAQTLQGTPESRVRNGIALVPEGRQVWAELTVFEHLRLGFRAGQEPRGAFASRVQEVYELFPRLAERRKQKAGSLSGGEQQMVAIARALISNPRVLLLDEPTLGLAPLVMETIGAALIAAKSSDRALLLAEQNADFALRYADRGYVLEVGKVRREGEAHDLAEHPELISAYLGIDVAGEAAAPSSTQG